MPRPPVGAVPAGLVPDGILLVDKPSGLTSHDVVDRVRRRFRVPKVGHGGTLDPQATGLLIVLIGRGTKLSSQFLASDKVYEGTVRLGVTTDSYDMDGRILKEADASGITRDQVEALMAAFVGDVMQEPPMVSAVKKDGVPLYKLARRGETVDRAPRLVHIYEFAMAAFEPPLVGFRMRCTKGTYVRSVCHEMGLKLGCGAALDRLRRTGSGRFEVSRATPLDQVMALEPEALGRLIIPLRAAQASL